MMPPQRFALLSLGVALLALGCSLPGAAPPTRYWVLAPMDGAAADAMPARVVGVGPFDLPAYLDRRALVARTAESELRVAARDSWGEDLRQAFPRTVGQNLEILLPATGAIVFPWSGIRTVDYQVAGRVSVFEVVEGSGAQLEVTWALSRRSDRKWIGGGAWRGQAPVEGSGPAAEVAALSRVLADFSREVARVLSQER